MYSIINLVNVEDIRAAHHNLTDMLPNQAILTFIEMLKSWPLFGSTLFEVSVSTFSLLFCSHDGIFFNHNIELENETLNLNK
jgi:hypothetical protein